MNVPMKSDLDFIKSLKPGDRVYVIEMLWNGSSAEVKIGQLVFDGFDKASIPNKDVYYGTFRNSEEGHISTGKHNLAYGFFQSPKLAIAAFRQYADSLVEACDKADKEEDKRLRKLLKAASKQEDKE